MMPGHLAELAPHLDDDRLRRRAHGADGQRAEEVDEHGADEGRHEDRHLGQVDRLQAGADLAHAGQDLAVDDQVDLVDVGAEEQEGGQRGRGDGVALGQRLGRVADRVEAVGDLAGALLRRG